MIVFNLQCGRDHRFEAWFKDSRSYESQRRARKVACPTCGDVRVTKAPTATNVATGAARERARHEAVARAKALREAVTAVHEHVAKTCEDVGPRFAEEARKIHYGEVKPRGIYGEATKDEAVSLADEGVPFACIPKLPESDA